MMFLNKLKQYWSNGVSRSKKFIRSYKSNSAGVKSERIAQKYLTQNGLTLIKRNFACKMGEIDLIMQDKDVLTFVEVRMRSTNDYGGALSSITYKKQQRIKKASLYYLKRFGTNPPKCRFDVVAIDGNQTKKAKPFKYNKKTYDLTWVKQAFS